VLTWSPTRRCIVAEVPELADEPLAAGATYAATLAAVERVLAHQWPPQPHATDRHAASFGQDAVDQAGGQPHPRRQLVPLAEERARYLAALSDEGAAHARADLAGSDAHRPASSRLMDRWGLAAVAWQHATDTLAAEPVATSDTTAFAHALAAAYDAAYRTVARGHGCEHLEHDDDDDDEA
jgi:hypothetical protein